MEGYDAKFDPPLDKRLECPICLLAQREPMQTPCGHRFCSACILRALSETGTRCPVDNTRVAVHQLFKDNFAKREVLSLHVHCHAEEHGCRWEGELRNLESHEKTCGLVTISCPNDCGHVFQRRTILGHLPLCSNHICPCSDCSISYPHNKLSEHAQFCSKIKLPDSILENISKTNEVLKWCGHLKMKVHGQNFSAVGYLSAKGDNEERFMYSGCWSSNINLIPLMGTASKLFWKTLQGPEVKPVELYFGILNSDSKSNNFQKMLKKKVNAVIGLRLKPSSRRELMIMYIHWSDSQKRLIAYVAELRNYLVREMQKKLQPLRRSSQYADFSQLSENIHSHPSRSGERANTARRGYNGSVRVINVPPTMPAASIESHAPPVVPSILSWQLSPSFPAYPWRVQAGGPSVPFFTIPSTPPQFLPAHSYPYTFAPMPAIATPPFSINPIQQVPAPLTVPSYAGVAVPHVSGLHAELVVSSADNAATMQGPRGFIADPTAPNVPLSHLTAGAVIHPYAHTTQDHTLSMAPGPAHPVNQVSVVVDPRLNPHVSVSGRQRQQQQPQGDHWVRSTNGRMMDTRARHSANNEPTSRQSGESLFHVMTSNARFSEGNHRRQDPAAMLSSHLSVPGPSGVQQHVSGRPVHPPSQSPNSLSPGVSGLSTLETSDDDSDLGSPFHWSLTSSTSPQHIQYIDPPNDYMLSESPSTRASSDESSESSPTSQQRAMGSALQTLADAAALLSSSPQSDSNSSEDVHLVANHISNTTGVAPPTTTSTSRSEPPPSQPVATPYSSHPPPMHPSMYRGNHSGVLTMPPQTNVYHPSQLAPAAYHPGPAHLEELPVFVPVIHPSVEHLEPSDSVGPLARSDGTAVLYAPHDGSVVMPPQPIPMSDMPSLIRVQGQRNMMPPDQWPAVVEQRTAQQLPPPPPAGFIRPRPMVATGPHAGGFWEEVMPSLDMRLHEVHTSMI